MPAGPAVARLLDFGVAKVLSAEVALTRTRGFLGTPLYMSPEQVAESRDLTGASDQWSLAVILYECVTGARPFHAPNLLALLNAISEAAPVAAHAREPSVPAGLSAVLTRALEKRPEARFPSVSAFGAALLPYASTTARAHGAAVFAEHEGLDGGTRPTPPTATLEPAARPPRARALPRRAVAVVGALATLGLLAAASARPRSSPRSTAASAVHPAAPHAPPAPVTPVTLPAAPARPLVAADVPRVAEDAPPSAARLVHGRGRGHTASSRAGAASPAPPPRPGVRVDCPNGICPIN